MPLIRSTLKIGNNSASGHDHITVEGEFVSNLVPNAHGSYNLGEANKMWNTLFVVNLQTNITDKQMVFADNGVLTGSTDINYEGGATTKRMSVGTSSYYGKLAIFDSSPAPFQAGTSYYGNQANYQLNVLGGNADGWGAGISFGFTSTVGASIIQKNVGTGNQSDLLFYTKEDTVIGNDPTLRMVMRYDGKIGIGNIYVPYGKLSIYDQNLNPLSSLTTTTNYHLGLYGTAVVGNAIGMSFGTTTLVGSAIVHKNTDTNNEGELLFYTNNAGSVTEKMVIKSDGKVGIGLNDPYADLEVEGTVGLSGAGNGGELEFRLNGTAAGNTQELGRIRFGNDSSTQASIYSVASQNWVGGSALGTNVIITGTAANTTNETPIVIFDPTQTTFNYAVYVNNSVTAVQFIGDGTQLTGIAKGQPTEMQYNDNGTLAGSVVQYEKTTGKVIMGANSNGFSSKLLIHDTSLNAYTDLASVSSYHLHISGSNSTGQAMGIGFGRDSSGVGGAVLFEDTGGFNQGELAFLTKSSTSSGVAPVERVRIHGSGIDVKGSTATYGGKVAFKNGTNYPQTNATIGLVTFGSILSDNALIRGGVPSNWNSGNRETDLSFWVTRNGQTSYAQMVVINGDGMEVTGDVQADYFIGDGSQLTNIPSTSVAGNTYNVQFNDNGNLAGDSSFNYYPTTDSLVVGIGTSVYGAGFLASLGTLNPSGSPTDHTRYGFTHTMTNSTGDSCGIGFMSGTNVMNNIIAEMISSTTSKLIFSSSDSGTLKSILTVQGDRVKTDSLLEISNPIDGENSPNLHVKGSSVSGEHAGIWLGTTNGTNHARITANNSSNGTLKITTREADSSHDLRMTLSSSGINIYENTVFQNSTATAERFSAIDTGRIPNYLHSNWHMSVQGSTTNSAGISFGNNGTAVAWGLLCDNSVYGDKRGDLKFQYPMNSVSTTMVDAMVIKGNTGRVGIGTDDPTWNLEVDQEMGISTDYIGGSSMYLTRDITAYSNMISGSNIGELSFNVSGYVSQSAANIVAKGDGSWSSTNRASRIEFYTVPFGSTVPTEKITIHNNSIDLKVQTFIDGGLDINSGAVSITNGGLTANGGSLICNSFVKGVTVQANALQANTAHGVSNQPTIISYTETGTDRIEINNTGLNVDFAYLDASNREIFYCDASGWVHLGCQDGQPQYNAFKWVADLQTSTGCYFEGYSAESMAVFVNRNTGQNADGIAVILGEGMTYSTLESAYSDFPASTQYYFTAYSKNYHTGSTLEHQPVFQGGIRASGSGGISWVASFTGMHASCAKQQPELKVGMIMVSTGEMWYKKSIETALPRTAPTSTPKDKRVYGVVASLEGSFPNYAKFGGVAEDEAQIDINAIGEGCILVTNIGGNIENGDYICSSEILGYGMLQDDDLLHNYTVAKCTETINWDDPNLETIEHNGQTYKVYLAACTYHCG